MKAAVLHAPGDIRIEDVPVPEPAPGEALVRTRASGICSGDVMPWYIEKKAPLVLGHEPAGEVVRLGAGVEGFGVGDRVFVHHHAPCLRCRHCRRGHFVQCPTWKQSRIIPGGIAEYILVPGVNLKHDTLVLPDGVSFEDGTLVEPLACVVKGIRRAGEVRGSRAVVIGLGTMGMLHILLLRHLGAEMIIGADRVPYRLERARELGADEAVDVSTGGLSGPVRRLTSGEMADLVVVGPNSADALMEGLSLAGDGGTVLMFTPVGPAETVRLWPNNLYFRDINLVTSYSAGPDDTRRALDLISRGVLGASDVVTHRFPIEGIAEAYALTARARNSLKCIIVF